MEDGTLLSIDCTAVENEVANSMYQRSELDWLIYNDPLAYAELILNGAPELYLKSSDQVCAFRWLIGTPAVTGILHQVSGNINV